MSRSIKEGKRGKRMPGSTEGKGVQDAIRKRHTYGGTEKILRRNRKTWTRLAAKRRRSQDKKLSKPE